MPIRAAVPGFARVLALPFLLAVSSAPASPAVTLTDANGVNNPVTYDVGPKVLPNIPVPLLEDSQVCDSRHPCDETPLAVRVSATTAATMRIKVTVSWPIHDAQSDFDLYIMEGSREVARSAGTFDPEITTFPAINAEDYNVRVIEFDPQGQTYTVKLWLEPIPAPTAAPAGPAARFHTFTAPGAMGAAAGEPSIGVNWNTGALLTQADTQTLYTTFNDSTSPAVPHWEDRSSDFGVIDFDPILFTDHDTGRTIVSLLVTDPILFTTGCSDSYHSDDDGLTWLPNDGCSHPGGSDHQSLGGGPYHAPVPALPNNPYLHPVYYCAQEAGAILIAPALCARSDDGGITFGPAVEAAGSDCFSLHGHPKVAPDGTVYVPHRNCATSVDIGNGVMISTDNGTTWHASVVPGASPSGSDPSVATGLNDIGKPAGQASNTVYLGYCDGDGLAKVAVSHDQAATWVNVKDVGASAGIKNCVFSQMTAGDDNRAALFFLGTTTAGDTQSGTFPGVWHAYVATTYDGGVTWGLYDATPKDPVQIGKICLGGIDCTGGRNLLDFNDAVTDKEGRVVGVFADGCLAPACTEGSPSSASTRSKLTLIRQSGGKTLFSAYDASIGNRIVPAAPQLLSATSANDGVTLKWTEPDDGGSPITAYRIYRGTSTGGETFLKSIAGDKPQFTDTTTHTGTTYYYKVSAVNANGEGASFGELSAAGRDVPNLPPTAGLTPASATIEAGQAVDFTVSAADADAGDTLAIDLDFGDGTTHGTAGGAVHHVYATAGSYTARLTVTDSHDAAATASSAVTVTPVQTATDETPDAFTFVQRTNVVTNAYITSEAKALTGFDAAAVSVGANGQYSLNGGAWTGAAGQAHPGDTLAVRHVSASTPSTQTDTVVTVGTYSTTFTSVTSAVDRTPDPFTFGTKTGVVGGSVVESDPVTLTGFNAAISLTAGPGLSYSIDGGAWTSAGGSLNPGQVLKVRHTATTTSMGYTKTYLKAGGVTGYFTTRTQ